MKRLLKWYLPIVLCVLVGAWLGTASDRYIEVNAMTGAERARTRRAYVFMTPWSYRTTEIAESARRQGLTTESGWIHLSTHSKRLVSELNACGRAPAAYRLGRIGPDDIHGETPDAFDRFVAGFVAADEETREAIAASVMDGSYVPKAADGE